MTELGRPKAAPDEKKIGKTVSAPQAVWDRVEAVADANRWPRAVAALVLIEEALEAREKSNA